MTKKILQFILITHFVFINHTNWCTHCTKHTHCIFHFHNTLTFLIFMQLLNFWQIKSNQKFVLSVANPINSGDPTPIIKFLELKKSIMISRKLCSCRFIDQKPELSIHNRKKIKKENIPKVRKIFPRKMSLINWNNCKTTEPEPTSE